MNLLPEHEAYGLLSAYGIQVPPFGYARTREEAVAEAERIGYPVVVKAVAAGLVHKSDAGGVVTGIQDRGGVRGAWDQVHASVSAAMPGISIDGVLVASQVGKGVEVLIGGKTDPAFGRCITVGSGGTLVELVRDVIVRVLPLTGDEARSMVRSLRVSALLRGYRGSEAPGEEVLVSAILSAARFFQEEETVSEFDLNPVILSRAGGTVVDARVYVLPLADRCEVAIRIPPPPHLLNPRSVAVVGASEDPKKIGYSVLRNLLTFPGQVYPVNPRHTEILGRRVYPVIGAIPGEVDMGVIAVPAPLVPGILREMAEKKVPVAVIVSSGFRETGPEGAAREEEILGIAKETGIRIVGPNCLGIMLPHVGLNTTFDPISARQGHIGFISQSGAVVTTIVDWSRQEGLGFSAVISVGNQSDLEFSDYLPLVAQDPETRVIILYVEEIRHGREFMRIVERVSREKPVVVLKSGSSAIGRTAAASHTGSLAGSYEVYQAAFLQSGAIPAYSLRECFDIAELLASEGYPLGSRSVVITTAGGFAVLASDYAERYGVSIPDLSPQVLAELDAFLPGTWSRRNPMDIIGDGGADRYARVFDVLTRHEDEWDIAFVIAVPSAVLDPALIAQEIVRFSRHTKNMIVGCILGGDTMRAGVRSLRDNSVPNYADIEDAFRAVGRVLQTKGYSMRDHVNHVPGFGGGNS